MEKYDKLNDLNDVEFKRVVGVKKETFELMCNVYDKYHANKKRAGGRPNKLSVGMQILFMLEYYREYRSLAHMSLDYGISEPTASRIVKEVESVLIKSGTFSLLGKKALYKEEIIKSEYIVIDATECPLQRPKKNNTDVSVENKKNIQQKDKL